MFKRFDEEKYTWDDTTTLIYKEDGSPFKNVTRQVLFEGVDDIPCQFRYFEVAPGGYSTLEHHDHTHMVMIKRGKGQCLLGDKIVDIKEGDFMVITSHMFHQFRANKGDYIGFLCLVNVNRDKVQLPTEEELEKLKANPEIKAFLES